MGKPDLNWDTHNGNVFLGTSDLSSVVRWSQAA